MELSDLVNNVQNWIDINYIRIEESLIQCKIYNNSRDIIYFHDRAKYSSESEEMKHYLQNRNKIG